MIQSNSEIRKQARTALEGNWGKGVIATLILFLLMSSFPTIYSFVDPKAYWVNAWTLLCFPLSWGFYIFFLNIFRNNEPSYGSLFHGYKDFVRIFLTILLQAIYTFLWTLLLIVPGIIKSLSYAMTPFVLKDHPELSYDAAISESSRMMKGYKMKLFLLELSFIGWIILALLTLGFGFLILQPYMQTALAAFYEDLKAERAPKQEEEPVAAAI